MDKASKKTAYFMMGSIGAGKSTVAKRRLPGVQIIDCDGIKETHPDYDPKAPHLVHEWSLQEVQKVLFRTMAGDADFAYDSTATRVEEMAFLMNQARTAGFSITLIYVPVDLETAIARNNARARTIPESIVREKYAMLPTAFEILSRYADRVEVIPS